VKRPFVASAVQACLTFSLHLLLDCVHLQGEVVGLASQAVQTKKPQSRTGTNRKRTSQYFRLFLDAMRYSPLKDCLWYAKMGQG
jgi:hypothetical protein